MFETTHDQNLFERERRAVIERQLVATKTAIVSVGRRTREALVADLERAGVRGDSRWMYGVTEFPGRGRLAYNPASLVAPRSDVARDVVEGLEQGVTIGSAGQFMPVPLSNATAVLGNVRAPRGQRGNRGAALYQKAIKRFGSPRLIPTSTGNLLALFPVRVSNGGRIGSGRDRDDAHWLPMFVLTREVQLRARTRARQIIAQAEQDAPAMLAAELAKAWA
jgi:hypothetical protein